jgi:hypothetical protein
LSEGIQSRTITLNCCDQRSQFPRGCTHLTRFGIVTICIICVSYRFSRVALLKTSRSAGSRSLMKRIFASSHGSSLPAGPVASGVGVWAPLAMTMRSLVFSLHFSFLLFFKASAKLSKAHVKDHKFASCRRAEAIWIRIVSLTSVGAKPCRGGGVLKSPPIYLVLRPLSGSCALEV